MVSGQLLDLDLTTDHRLLTTRRAVQFSPWLTHGVQALACRDSHQPIPDRLKLHSVGYGANRTEQPWTTHHAPVQNADLGVQ